MLLILLVVLGYLAARFAVDWLARHALVVAGAEYLVLGLLLGPRGTELLSTDHIRALSPFFTLAIGWMGVSVGFRFWIPVLTRTPAMLYRLAFIQSTFTVALVGTGAWLIIWRTGMLSQMEAMLPASILAAIAVASSLQGARIAARSLDHSNLAVRQLEVASGFDALFAIVLISVALAINHPSLTALTRDPTATEWVAISLGIGAVGGWLFHLFLGNERSMDRLFIAVAGAVVLTTGAANYVGMSALLPGLLLGLILVNTTRQRDVVGAMLHKVDRPLYFVMLVCAGALWSPSTEDVFLPVLAVLTLRFIGKVAGAWLASRANGMLEVFGPRWGLALVGQGGLAIALALDYSLAPGALRPNLVFTAAVCSVLITDLFSAQLARNVVAQLPKEISLPPEPSSTPRSS